MEIIRHLSDSELENIAFESDQQHLREALVGLPGLGRNFSHRPDVFWEGQRHAIWSRISAPQHRIASPFPLLAWSTLAALALLAAALLNAGGAEPVSQAQEDPDHQLLIQVERVMQSGGPQALEPAALLAQEIGEYSVQGSAQTHSKEAPHEN